MDVPPGTRWIGGSELVCKARKDLRQASPCSLSMAKRVLYGRRELTRVGMSISGPLKCSGVGTVGDIGA